MIPSILDLAKVPADRRVIGLPDGRQIRISIFLASWQRIKTLPPDATVNGWNWYPLTAREVLADISRGVLDRISLRSGERRDWRDNSARIEATRRARVQCSCRWCGQPLAQYQQPHARFCDPSCYRSYYH